MLFGFTLINLEVILWANSFIFGTIVYISNVVLLPQLLQKSSTKQFFLQVIFVIIGIVISYLTGIVI